MILGWGIQGFMPYLCPTFAIRNRSDFVFLRPWAFSARQDAPRPQNDQNDSKMTPKWLQNNSKMIPKMNKNHIKLLKIDIQKNNNTYNYEALKNSTGPPGVAKRIEYV